MMFCRSVSEEHCPTRPLPHLYDGINICCTHYAVESRRGTYTFYEYGLGEQEPRPRNQDQDQGSSRIEESILDKYEP